MFVFIISIPEAATVALIFHLNWFPAQLTNCDFDDYERKKVENKVLREDISVLELKLKELENKLEEANKVSAFLTKPDFFSFYMQKGVKFRTKNREH